MNNPEYIVVDEIGKTVEAVKTTLGLSVLNYQFGYINEINEMLIQYAKNVQTAKIKFPLAYCEPLFNITRGKSPAIYGEIDVLRLFVINQTPKMAKAKDRLEVNFKPVIYPIVREWLKQIDLSVAFATEGVQKISHTLSDRFYWGESQQSQVTDAVDCTIITIRGLQIHNNNNCQPTC